MRHGDIRKCAIVPSLSNAVGRAKTAAFSDSTSRSTLPDASGANICPISQCSGKSTRWPKALCGRLGMFGLRGKTWPGLRRI